jgi:hypothetical protein
MGAPATTRRATLAGALSLAAAPAVASAAAWRIDPADPLSALRTYRRMRLSDDDRVFFWWMSGTRYAQIENKLTAMFDIEICSIFKVETAAPDRFTLRSLEMVVNRAVGGGLLERWDNPLTGETLTPVYRPVGPVVMQYTKDGPGTPPQLPGSRVAVTRPRKRLVVQGDDVLLRDDSQAEVTRDGSSDPPYRVNDFAEYHASRRDVERLSRPWVPATVAFTAVTGWQRWWNMGDRAGGSVARAMGAKTDKWDTVPAFTREAIAKLWPQIATDPAAALLAAPFRFER